MSPALAQIQAAWARIDTAPLRACQLCAHERVCEKLQCCGHPSSRARQPTLDARASHGICGPNAVLMQPRRA